MISAALNCLFGSQDAYDISQLRHPVEPRATSRSLGRPPLRRDAPFSYGPQPHRALPTSPSDIANFISDVGALGSVTEWVHVCLCAYLGTSTLMSRPCFQSSRYRMSGGKLTSRSLSVQVGQVLFKHCGLE